jgi:hypothetical protein
MDILFFLINYYMRSIIDYTFLKVILIHTIPHKYHKIKLIVPFKLHSTHSSVFLILTLITLIYYYNEKNLQKSFNHEIYTI